MSLTTNAGTTPVHSVEFQEIAWSELEEANALTIDTSQGLRAAIPSAANMLQHYANAYLCAILSLVVGTRVQQ